MYKAFRPKIIIVALSLFEMACSQSSSLQGALPSSLTSSSSSSGPSSPVATPVTTPNPTPAPTPMPTSSPTQVGWSGILNPTRAAPWSRASVGVPGGIPSASWTQCGSTIGAYGTQNAPGNVATINNAIAACGNNQYVLLGVGTFWLNGGIVVSRSNVVLRGSGASTTVLEFPNGGTDCVDASQDLCVTNTNFQYPGSPGSMPGGAYSFNWTSGFNQGATSITVATVGSTGINNGDMIVLDQANDMTDNGGEIICDQDTNFNCHNNTESPGYAGRTINGVDYSQEQIVRVTSGCANGCTGAGPFTLNISPGLYANNWNGTSAVGGFFVKPLTMIGFESLTVDDSNDAPCIARSYQCGNIGIENVDSWWVRNVRSIDGQRNHVWTQMASHGEVRDSYFYGTQAAATESYGWEIESSSDNLFENNILQKIASPTVGPGAASGNVYGYNFWINDYYTGASGLFMQDTYMSHDAGNSFNLYEGNDGNAVACDDIHGTSALDTVFRNWLNGRDYNTAGGNGSQPTQDTQPIGLSAYCRGYNVIGNVLGTPGYHTLYESFPPANLVDYATCNTTIYDLGAGGGDCNNLGSGGTTNDPGVRATLMRWGNYDVVSNAISWNSVEASPAAVAHISAQSVPASKQLPASFYQSAKPSFWGSMPWPATGPDVSGGVGPGGFANRNPAAVCYYQKMSGPIDGSGGVLTFDSSNCY